MTIKNLSELSAQLRHQPIIFVGGKGGVGKTTTSAALASHFAEQQQKTLIISTDPAHSLGDVLNVPLNNQATKINDYLYALELNPEQIVDEHFAQVEKTIKGYANPEMLPKVREHLQLSKTAPGAIEAAMLEAMCHYLVDANAQGYEHIIFDTAPTGYTLRLLMLPEMMSSWTDGLLAQQRRQAKLKSVANHLDIHKKNQDVLKKDGLKNPFTIHQPDRWEQAVSVLEKRKQLFRQAGQLLHDANKTAIILVMIADVLPLAETKRAIHQLKQAGLSPCAVVVNQLIHGNQTDEFWQSRYQRQQQLLKDIDLGFTDYPIYAIFLQKSDVRGTKDLSRLLET